MDVVHDTLDIRLHNLIDNQSFVILSVCVANAA